MRFYFDLRDNGTFVRDDEGFELADLESARREAARAVADSARDSVPNGFDWIMAIYVRDGAGNIVHTAELTFETSRPTG